ncbi:MULTISPECIES: DNA repair exonuclease [unclassified Bacillus (in: firmicutes)]|uniref:metallophosphoesterase family protein n=1 Tax=unclassified Bacillus (in: firmicutes) TaxID=185979 RepID=UPI0008F2B226|nr:MULTISPECIES: DNA repair exonuclease [unclassified Bacillus (in: firmicutes)]SFA80061.1 DNA repair exonuclease SbcCD nuclease subunit [Bacillus sp. UNCCL13]SFQ70124.1 DNA repair exonuclease SbcCD nuclease subunit [Bacillus sp. cl95]
MKQIKFIHAADLHLDSPMQGLKHLPKEIITRLRESTFTAFKKITEAALQHSVDFVVLAGDLYDGEDRSIKAQARFKKEMEKLAAAQIPVYIIHGNHDHLNGTWIKLDMPESVHIFNENVEVSKLKTKSDAVVHLYGFSYEQRHVIERKIDSYMKKDWADFHIGILHGQDGADSNHAAYAPFQVQDLLEKKFDYWALGHIHKRAILCESPPIVYPGNIQGRHKKELGEKGCYLVTLTEREAELDFIATADVVWKEIQLDITSAKHFQDVYSLCRQTIENNRENGKGTLLSMSLENQETETFLTPSLVSELLEVLQDEEKEMNAFVWLIDLNVMNTNVMSLPNTIYESEFLGELFAEAESIENIEQAISVLYDHHHLGRKYLSPLEEKEEQELIMKAQTLLANLLTSAKR